MTLEELVLKVREWGARIDVLMRVEGTLYKVSAYKVVDIIRVDLKPQKED